MSDSKEETYDIRFKLPFTGILSGPSRCGKSTFIANVLRNMDHLYDKKPGYTICFYESWQPIYEQLRAEGLVDEWAAMAPTKEYLLELANDYKGSGGIQVIVDDQMLKTDINADLASLFTVGSHHADISIWYLTQSLFNDDKAFRTMKLNATYIVLFKNPGSQKQADSFFNMFRPRPYSTDLKKIFQKVTKNMYSYLLFDLHQETNEDVRIRTKIFPSDGVCEVFVPVD